MKPILVDYLVCPVCKGALNCAVYQEDPGFPWSEIVDGCLTCRNCGCEYPIQRGIPRMLAEQLSSETQNTVDGFGFEWLRFNTQILDTYMTGKAHFLDFIYPIKEDFFDKKFVLDAGCGMGRFLKLGAEFGSAQIIGIDLSQSVEAAYQNTCHLENAHVVQANIFALPFTNIFDYIFSIGVLHHLDDPGEGFSQLVKLLKQDGRISVWVYSEENNRWVIALTPIRKHITSRLPKPILLGLSHFIGSLLYILFHLVYKPLNETKLRNKIKHLLPYNDYFYYSSRLSYRSLVSVVFDHLVPELAEYISRDELNDWFIKADLDSVLITPRNNMSWRGTGARIS